MSHTQCQKGNVKEAMPHRQSQKTMSHRQCQKGNAKQTMPKRRVNAVTAKSISAFMDADVTHKRNGGVNAVTAKSLSALTNAIATHRSNSSVDAIVPMVERAGIWDVYPIQRSHPAACTIRRVELQVWKQSECCVF